VNNGAWRTSELAGQIGSAPRITKLPKLTMRLSFASGGPQAQGWTRKYKGGHRQCLAGAGCHPLAISQTRPATRRVADGERMNRGKKCALAPMRKAARSRQPPRQPNSHDGWAQLRPRAHEPDRRLRAGGSTAATETIIRPGS